MNWRRGIFRAWIVASVLWICAVTWIAYARFYNARSSEISEKNCADTRRANPALGNPYDCFVTRPNMFDDLIPFDGWVWMYAPMAFGPPIGAAALCILCGWIASGFARTKS